MKSFILSLCVILLFSTLGYTETDTAITKEVIKKEVLSLQYGNVVLGTDTVLVLKQKSGPLTAFERGKRTQGLLEEICSSNNFDSDLFSLRQSPNSADISYSSITVLSVSNLDTIGTGLNLELLSKNYYDSIVLSSIEYEQSIGFFATVKRIVLSILVFLSMFLVIRLLNKLLTAVNKKLVRFLKGYLSRLKFKNYDLISKEREEQLIRFVLKSLKWILIASVVYLTLPLLFSIFPSTEGIASTLIGYVINPLSSFFAAIIAYVPELITVVVIVYLTKLFVDFLKFVANEVDSQRLQIPGFYSDWAKPTFLLLKIFVYAFALVLIFPYLPGSKSPAFQGVSVFLGVLLSLGSSAAIGNVIAGLVITYMRAFKIGDRVKIGDTTGDVLEKTMLVTRLRTIKNEDITIPNSAILNGNTTNFSTNSSAEGLILNSTVTIGYDVPWQKVEEILIKAAKKTNNILQKPEPFVLQTSLDDFYVSYQINAYTEMPKKASKIYSDLHSNIQDEFNDAGVEILSPHYFAARDGNQMAVPPNYLPPDYQSPYFRVKSESKSG